MTNLERYKTKDISSGHIAAEILGYVSTLKGLSNIQFTDYIQDLKDFLDSEAKDENEGTEIEKVLDTLKDLFIDDKSVRIILLIGDKKPKSSIVIDTLGAREKPRASRTAPYDTIYYTEKYAINVYHNYDVVLNTIRKVLEVSGLSKDNADYLLNNGIKGEVINV